MSGGEERPGAEDKNQHITNTKVFVFVSNIATKATATSRRNTADPQEKQMKKRNSVGKELPW